MRGPELNSETEKALERPQITASQLPRLFKCNGSLFLPNENETSEAAERGTEIHKYLEWLVNDMRGVKTEKPQLSIENAEFCQKIDVQEIRALIKDASDVFAEQAFGFDVDAAFQRHNGVARVGRVYKSQSTPSLYGVVYGTCDLVVKTDDGFSVYDFKTGITDYGDPSKSPQLLAAAYAFSARVAGFVYIRHDGSVYIKETVLTPRDISEFQEAAKGVFRYSPLVTGNHCKYCPSFKFCPQQKQIAKHLDAGVLDPELPTLSADTAPRILEKLELAEKLLEKVRKQVEDFARESPFQTTDGATFGPKETVRESINGDAAIDIIGKAFGFDVAAKATKTTLTKTALGEALGDYAKSKGLKKAEVMREAMDALKNAGAVEYSRSVTVGRIK